MCRFGMEKIFIFNRPLAVLGLKASVTLWILFYIAGVCSDVDFAMPTGGIYYLKRMFCEMIFKIYFLPLFSLVSKISRKSFRRTKEDSE